MCAQVRTSYGEIVSERAAMNGRRGSAAMPMSENGIGRNIGEDLSARPLVGASRAIGHLREQIATLSSSTCNVLVLGESGVGKELVARQLHTAGRLGKRPFVPVDCGALCQTLFESQLFGHIKGAFTGADRDTLGFCRAADGGTLFFDEIGELGLPMQAKLLRCIQEKAVTPVGADRPLPVNIRVIAATNRDLRRMIRAGEFREELFYRLNVVSLTVPPLRDRREDVPALAQQFVAEFARLYREPAKELSAETLAALQAYDWPGNVRELENAVEYLYAMRRDRRIEVSDLPQSVVTESKRVVPQRQQHVLPWRVIERNAVLQALGQADGNQAMAARLLEIDTRRLYRMVRHHGLQTATRNGRA